MTESVLKVRRFMRLYWIDRENVGLKMVCNFLGKDDEKNTEKPLLTLA